MIHRHLLLVIFFSLVGCASDSQPDVATKTNPSTAQPTQPTPPLFGGDECTDPRDSFADKAIVEDICRRTNAERQAVGVKVLTLDLKLLGVAQAHAEDMVKRGYFSHTNPDGLSPFDRMHAAGIFFSTAGENIAYWYDTPAAVMSAWMGSSGHKANILNGGYGKLGVGFYQNYWVQDFTN